MIRSCFLPDAFLDTVICTLTADRFVVVQVVSCLSDEAGNITEHQCNSVTVRRANPVFRNANGNYVPSFYNTNKTRQLW